MASAATAQDCAWARGPRAVAAVGPVCCLAAAPPLLACGTGDGSVHVFRFGDGALARDPNRPGYILSFVSASACHTDTTTACALLRIAVDSGSGGSSDRTDVDADDNGAAVAAYLLASAADDGTVCVRSLAADGRERESVVGGAAGVTHGSAPFMAHEGGVSSLLLLEAGLCLVTGGAGGVMRAWRRARHCEAWGGCVWQAHEHTEWVTALQLVGAKLVSGGQDGAIRVWAPVSAPAGGNGAVWVCERALEGHHGAVCALAQLEGRLVSASRDHSLRVWS